MAALYDEHLIGEPVVRSFCDTPFLLFHNDEPILMLKQDNTYIDLIIRLENEEDIEKEIASSIRIIILLHNSELILSFLQESSHDH